jgi:hypothetical protein
MVDLPNAGGRISHQGRLDEFFSPGDLQQVDQCVPEVEDGPSGQVDTG